MACAFPALLVLYLIGQPPEYALICLVLGYGLVWLA